MVIARFSWIKAGLVLCFLLPMTGLGVHLLYQHNWDLGFWLFLVSTPLFARYAFALLYELLFHGARPCGWRMGNWSLCQTACRPA